MTTRVQGGRTATPASPPANNSLQPGELYVEMASPLRLWTGVPTAVTASGVKLILDATAQAAANGAAVQKAGDVMTGPLTLSGSPTQPNQAANKAYADTKVGTVAGHPGPDVVLTHTDISDWTSTLAPYALLASPPLTGNPTAPTPAPGDNDTSIATTAFVNTAIAAQPGTVIAPNTPAFKAGQLWWDATGGSLYVGYDDGNTQAYVPATNITLPANAATKADVGQALNDVGRNLIHNPLFNISQRTGPFTTLNTFCLDRWQNISTDAINIVQAAADDGQRAQTGDEAMTFFLSNTFTGGTGGAASYCILRHNMESVRRLAGKTVIVSFYASASAALKLGVSIDQYFGGGGSPSAPVNGTGQSVTLTTLFARYSMTFVIPSIAGKTLGTDTSNTTMFQFWYSGGSSSNTRSGSVGIQSGTVNIWGVQLEIATAGQTTPTPLEKPDPQQDLAKCQRFYWEGHCNYSGYGVAGQSIGYEVIYPVEMRATPQITIGGIGTANTTGINASQTSKRGTFMQAVVTATAQAAFGGQFFASADL